MNDTLIRVWYFLDGQYCDEGKKRSVVFPSKEAAFRYLRDSLSHIDIKSRWREIARGADRLEARRLARIAEDDPAARIALDALVERIAEEATNDLDALAALAYGVASYAEVIDWQVKIRWQDKQGEHWKEFATCSEAVDWLQQAAAQSGRSMREQWHKFATKEERERMAQLESQDDKERRDIIAAIEHRVFSDLQQLARFAMEAHDVSVGVEVRPEPTVRA
jgi:hypothetical protein